MRFTLLIFSFFSGGVLSAQNIYNGGSVITIGATSVVYVKDTLINQGTIVNNGHIQVDGSWINNAQYDAGQGQITFNSNRPQIINHNDQSFSRLVIRGGGEKIIQADITIEGELDLTDGVLVSENQSRIVFASSAQLTGGSDVSHVRGPVYHLGAGNKLFPVGNGVVYLPVELSNIEGSSAEIGVSAVELGASVLAASPSLKAISTKRYWKLDVVSGSLGNALVTLPVRDEVIIGDTDKIVIAQSKSVEEDFESLGGTDFQGTTLNGRLTSEKTVSENFVAIATALSGDRLVVYNFLSPNEDQSNDFLVIGNIENFPENKFTLFNRWGDKVFELVNYDNRERVFRGKSNIGGETDLVTGTYFYTIETKIGGTKLNGFLVVKN